MNSLSLTHFELKSLRFPVNYKLKTALINIESNEKLISIEVIKKTVKMRILNEAYNLIAKYRNVLSIASV